MLTIDDLKGKNYFTCAACMSVWADALSWANANTSLVTKNIEEADNVIVLSCQVTDLAVLNDFKTVEKLKQEFPNKNFFISGCLAQRMDIPMPEGVERLEQMRCNYEHINNRSLVNFEKPFWVKDFKENDNELSDGNLFRNKYPLRIGKGCSFNCTYCTIKMTRGKHEKYDIQEKVIEEFLKFDDVLLIADSPTEQQIKDWCNLAIEKNKKISIRNIEPQVAIKCKQELIFAAKNGVLDVFHCPIQSNSIHILEDMNRHVEDTFKTIELAKHLKSLGVKIATNIIIDYKNFTENYEDIFNIYDYVSWNPYWDGKWNREKAEQRFNKYLNGK
jgi:tRNA A37 methylthiotransferase MiaB